MERTIDENNNNKDPCTVELCFVEENMVSIYRTNCFNLNSAYHTFLIRSAVVGDWDK